MAGRVRNIGEAGAKGASILRKDMIKMGKAGVKLLGRLQESEGMQIRALKEHEEQKWQREYALRSGHMSETTPINSLQSRPTES